MDSQAGVESVGGEEEKKLPVRTGVDYRKENSLFLVGGITPLWAGWLRRSYIGIKQKNEWVARLRQISFRKGRKGGRLWRGDERKIRFALVGGEGEEPPFPSEEWGWLWMGCFHTANEERGKNAEDVAQRRKT